MSRQSIKPRNYIGIDYGAARIGVARAGFLAKIAEPLTTLLVDGTEVNTIIALAEQEEAGTIVLGRPRGLDGQVTPQTAIVENFAKHLRVHGFDVQLVDEALTSVAAEDLLKEKHRPKWPHEDVDSIAAMILLDDYLHSL